MARPIKKVLVLGAGVMGSGIAAHLSGCGIKVHLLDILPKEPSEEEKAKGLDMNSPEVRNRLANAGLKNALSSKPALFYSPDTASLITPGNFEDDLMKAGEVDWIVEVVIENLDIKRKVFNALLKYYKEGTIVSSNTSGLSIKDMTEGFPDDFKKHFLVTHFFNPVRYMRLLEIIPGEETLPEVVSRMADFGERILGKGVVYGKDTPNFIANRIGVYGLMSAIRYMLEDGLSIEEVDSIFGPPMGRPKSAIFRTADMVGLDTLIHVINNVYEGLPNDPDREVFKVPEFLKKMVENRMLGQKTQGGFYKVEKGKNGKNILSLDIATLTYKPRVKTKFDSIGATKNIEDEGEKVKTIVNYDDRAGRYAWKVTRDTLLYSAKRVGEIADDIVNIDRAMRWGFNWKQGPFETWDAIGVVDSVERMVKEGFDIPPFVEGLLKKGDGRFYTSEKGRRRYWCLKEVYEEIPEREGFILLKDIKEREKVILKNPGGSLIDLGDGVACLEFHTKMNAIDDDIIEMIFSSLEEVNKNYLGLVIGNQAENFSVGANLMLLLMESVAGNWEGLSRIVSRFQEANMAMKYNERPVVAAPFGMVLGGGCEVCLGAQRMRASAELYMGLVEVGVGLIPAGGGCKEMLIRITGKAMEDPSIDLLPWTRKVFETIGMAKVSTSAMEAKKMGFLKEEDGVTINPDHLLHDAKKTVLAMAKESKGSGFPRRDLRLGGEGVYSAIKIYLYSMLKSGYITEHDRVIGEKLAYVLTGGNAPSSRRYTEQDILDMEREAFLSLCGMEKTRARMQYMLMEGKPLRN